MTMGVLSGCDLDPGSSSTARSTPARDPDEQIVEAARDELRALLERLSPTGRTASLVEAHHQQLAALDGQPRAGSGHRMSWTTARAVARERRAAERFTHWAVTCRNGDLARVLASIAAGIRMQPLLRRPTPDRESAS
jgi:hypothetical protein